MTEAKMASVVQFPHPGPEHKPPPAGDMPWNTGSHRRKFLRAGGQWIDDRGAQHQG